MFVVKRFSSWAFFIKDLWTFIPNDLRRSFYFLSIFIFLNSLSEVFGIASIIPFVSVVSSPDMIYSQPALKEIYSWGFFSSHINFIYFMGVLTLLIIVLRNSLNALLTFSKTRYAELVDCAVSEKLLSQYAYQPYEKYVERNSSELVKNVISEVPTVIKNVLFPFVDLLSNIFTVFFIFVMLVVVSRAVSLGVFVVVGGAYLIIYSFFKSRLSSNGLERIVNNKKRFKIAYELLSSIKELRILGKEGYFLYQFRKYTRRYSMNHARALTYSLVPRNVMEIIVFGGTILLVLLLLNVSGNVTSLLPVISIYALAAYRLMPAVQTIYSDLTKINFHLATMRNILSEIKLGETYVPATTKSNPRMSCKNDIKLSGISHCYTSRRKWVLSDASLDIPFGSVIGLVGKTGSGKTTLVDIMLGLIIPTKGAVLIDSVPLTPLNVTDWFRNIGYVPQTIFLVDDTIAANIALGVKSEDVDSAKLLYASKIAHVSDFVENELPEGYQTIVGDRGLKLSGGQRQRIGIARALYNNPSLVVLDEATNALDSETEEVVISNILSSNAGKTIVMVSHKPSTLKKCDCIYVLENGKIADHGSYDSLSLTNRYFDSTKIVDASKNKPESF
ncbi:MAG: hypothetical protein ACD_22C00136G0002 [uncultured bacterium]|nr:MAG: hypothetical protein ACD_22C00136G0002 [uncultured bacterium]